MVKHFQKFLHLKTVKPFFCVSAIMVLTTLRDTLVMGLESFQTIYNLFDNVLDFFFKINGR